jgi:quaternary ammonium compound-resistance protein SugE
MAWIILVLSGVPEAIWATALGRSDGLSRPGPSAVFLIALVLSMCGLAVAMRELPVGTAYAVWVEIGAVLTAGYAMSFGGEAVSLLRGLLLAGVVLCVIGLKLAPH